ncbi:MAG: GNAT family N-acetyltransferase [Chloroflexota bacterium]
MDATSKRLHIRDLAEEDWPALHMLRTDPDVYRYNHFGPENVEATRTWIRETMVHNNLTPRRSHNCTIVLRAKKEVIGWIGFGLPGPEEADHSDLTFGYALLPAFWNRGYMTEAVQAMINFAFTNVDSSAPVNSISATCDVRNIGSMRVMEKAGLCQVDRFVELDDETGETADYFRYRILHGEWANATHKPAESSDFVVQGPFHGQGGTCEPVLRDLPNWFGIEEATKHYIQEIDTLPTFLACQGDEVVGFLSLKSHNSHSAEVYVMGIKKDRHRRGIGKKLLHEAEAHLQAQEVEYLQAKTLSNSHPDEGYAKTRAFYQAVGFRPLEELPTLWGEENPCLLMIKRL